MDNIELIGTLSADGALQGTISPGQVPSDPVLQDVTVKSTDTQQTVEAVEGYDGIGIVTVEALDLQAKAVTLGSQQQVIEPDAGKDGLSSVTVPAVSLQNKTVTPTASQQTVTADAGYDGLGTVTVDAQSGGTDTLDELFNGNQASIMDPISFTMTDNNSNHSCYGFSPGLNVTLPSTITKITGGAFYKQEKLLSLNGSGVTTVQGSAFANSGVTSVSLPAVTSYDDYAFINCQQLPSIRCGAGVTQLPEGFAQGCWALTDIYLGATSVVSLPDLTYGYPLASGGSALTVHVPASVLSQYQNDSDWQAMIAAAANDGLTISIVGDYA